MTRIYENTALSRRNRTIVVLLILPAVYGLWELWNAANSVPGYQYLWGIAFIGGAAYGLRQTIVESRDLVTAFDVDPASNGMIATLWRPLGGERLEGGRDRYTDWRFYVRIGRRNAHTYYLYVNHPDHPRPIQFELRPGTVVNDELRRLAPEAISEFEEATAPKAG